LEQAAATRRTIDLLLTDVVMPRIGGAELAQQMSVVHPEARVLFMSGHADPFLDAKALEKASVLQKPFALSKLSQAIREVLRASFDGGSEREDRCPSV
jgi:DNA-binding NtrC family response regulator